VSPSVTLEGWTGKRLASLAAGAVMATSSHLTMRHFFAANDPDSIRESSFCDNSAVFNCGSSAYSSISAVGGVPINLCDLSGKPILVSYGARW